VNRIRSLVTDLFGDWLISPVTLSRAAFQCLVHFHRGNCSSYNSIGGCGTKDCLTDDAPGIIWQGPAGAREFPKCAEGWAMRATGILQTADNPAPRAGRGKAVACSRKANHRDLDALVSSLDRLIAGNCWNEDSGSHRPSTPHLERRLETGASS